MWKEIKESKYLFYKDWEYSGLISRTELVEKLKSVWLEIYQWEWVSKIFIDENSYAIIKPEIKEKLYACSRCWFESKQSTNHYLETYSFWSVNQCKNIKCKCSGPAISPSTPTTIWKCKDKPTLAEILVRELWVAPSSIANNGSDLWILSEDKIVRYLDKNNIPYTRSVSDVKWQDWYWQIMIEVNFAYSEYYDQRYWKK